MALFRSQWSLIVALGLAGVAASPACLLELDQEIACGDGWVDRSAGEECEPDIEESYIDGCLGTLRPEGVATCDPVTCAVINDRAQCGFCGDGRVDEELGEECDGDNFKGRACPGAGGVLQCSADCKRDESRCLPCGNGRLDEGEECDPSGPIDTISTKRPCAATSGQEGLTPVWDEKPYASGDSTSCDRATCRFSRVQCGYCGDGVRDGETSVGPGQLSRAEYCDGSDKDERRVDEVIGLVCPIEGERPNVECIDCFDFELRAGEPTCCKARGETCPSLVESTKCCYAYDHPGEEPCEDFFVGEKLFKLCK